MNLYSLKSKISALLSDAAASIERSGVYTSIKIYFEDSKFSESEEWNKKSEYLVGELSVYTDNTSADDALVYIISVGCASGNTVESEISSETEAFKLEIAELVKGIEGSDDAAHFIDELIKEVSAEGEKMISDFEKHIDKIKKTSLIVSAVGIGAILVVWLLFLLF